MNLHKMTNKEIWAYWERKERFWFGVIIAVPVVSIGMLTVGILLR